MKIQSISKGGFENLFYPMDLKKRKVNTMSSSIFVTRVRFMLEPKYLTAAARMYPNPS